MDTQITTSFPLVPILPEGAVDWQGIERQFPWIRAMAGVPQDPVYHAEGDVLIHTGMVAAAMASHPAWRTMHANDRATLFAAALLHDVAKPACTQVDANGTITSRGHARRGEVMARQLMYEAVGFDTPVSFAMRERIAKLVRHHGLPLWFFERDDPARAVIEASQTVSLAQVALLAEADVRGRACPDQRELLDRIAYFREFCIENQCLGELYPFPSAHSRFRYCTGRQTQPDYAAWDDTACEVVLMAGLPGAGKDTWVSHQCPDWPVISLDAIREERGIAPTDAQGAVIQEAKELARVFLRAGTSFVWNATNITRMLRAQLIDLFAAYRARVRIVYVEVPYATLLQRNRERAAGLPEGALERLIAKVEVPDVTEAHRVDYVLA